MTPARQEVFIQKILKVLDANRTRWGVPVEWIASHLPEHGFTQDDFGSEQDFKESILDKLDYLSKKRMVDEVLKIVNKGNRSWRITTEGIDYLDQHG